MAKLHGTGIALITPFTKKGKIDFISLQTLSKSAIVSGIDYLVLLGTTGEPSTLRLEEKQSIIDCVQEVNQNRVPIVLSIGGNNTKEVVKTIQETNLSSFEAILLVSPHYNRPSQEGLYQHFKEIAENTVSKIILYNVPSRTGSNILPTTVIRLTQTYKNIIGIKEASGQLLQSYQILKEKPDYFSLISGDDALSLPIILGGGDGVISVLAQAFPTEFSNMIRYAIQKKPLEAFTYYYQLFELVHLIYEEGSPTGIKALLNILGICEPYMRLPLVMASPKLTLKIKNSYTKYINQNISITSPIIF